MTKQALFMTVCGAVLLGLGCNSAAPSDMRASGVGSCAPGGLLPCTCGDGTVSQQICDTTGVFGACVCTGHEVGNGTGNGSGTGNSFDPGGSAGFSGGASGVSGGNDGLAGTFGGAGTDGAAGSGGGAGTDGGGAGTGVTTSGAEPKIPSPSDACPTLATGTITVKGQQVQLWVGTKQADKKGAVFFYWHGTGSNSNEAVGGLGGALQEITGEGGVVASFTTTTKTGTNTGNNVWYTGDFEMADIILKCAVEQLNIDTRRVYTGGCSAGGLQAGSMAFGRSSYLASVMPNSGGGLITTQDDPTHMPAVITAHGAMGKDVVVIDFSQTSNQLCTTVASKGGFAVDCDHGGGHCASPSPLKAAQWEFLKAHPFGVAPEPYSAGLPATFPSYCKIIK